MSADNGIYIGQFPDGFRVIHAQAIENCDDTISFPQEMTDLYRVLYYGRERLITSKAEAYLVAQEKYEQQLNDPMCPICEYGINLIQYFRPLLPMDTPEAQKKLDEFWETRRKERLMGE